MEKKQKKIWSSAEQDPALSHEAVWQRLQQMEADAQDLMGDITEDGLGDSLRESIQELSVFDNHPADVASEVFERGKDLALRDYASLTLDSIERAKKKITEGIYGRCDDCGEAIATERLLAMPTARYCMGCQQRYEETHPIRTRPLEEAIPPYIPAYGGDHLFTRHDTRQEEPTLDSVAFDGEDTWQILGRYGSSDTPSDVDTFSAYPDIAPRAQESVGAVEDIDGMAVEQGEDGMFYQDFDGVDDELGALLSSDGETTRAYVE
ncbi:TraR/DksA C4-type zinc finger protein [Heliophilum fasciatum]|uniref:TraR/DksA family transcriptional regulator n=1 Tax=Heliophilum fasciatum TaxID=35700 RepID=A0A4V2SWG4_9FIRM|nr:TraR/DksA C4-type zinc finger protein [Heliophilum fasciatum]MCW2278892.1 YteA family regulatory protein [Heliophilum fasciatum]TCP62096.1 TraR/DksA family transcriptional regulator [Heliophilum fasciatum]